MSTWKVKNDGFSCVLAETRELSATFCGTELRNLVLKFDGVAMILRLVCRLMKTRHHQDPAVQLLRQSCSSQRYQLK